MAARTRSSSGPARAAVLLGALSVAAIPAGVLAARYLAGVRLLEATVVAVPVGLAFGLAALGSARAAGERLRWTIRAEGARAVRAGRLLGGLGTYLGVTGALALGVYLVLRLAS